MIHQCFFTGWCNWNKRIKNICFSCSSWVTHLTAHCLSLCVVIHFLPSPLPGSCSFPAHCWRRGGSLHMHLLSSLLTLLPYIQIFSSPSVCPLLQLLYSFSFMYSSSLKPQAFPHFDLSLFLWSSYWLDLYPFYFSFSRFFLSFFLSCYCLYSHIPFSVFLSVSQLAV